MIHHHWVIEQSTKIFCGTSKIKFAEYWQFVHHCKPSGQLLDAENAQDFKTTDAMRRWFFPSFHKSHSQIHIQIFWTKFQIHDLISYDNFQNSSKSSPCGVHFIVFISKAKLAVLVRQNSIIISNHNNISFNDCG